MNTDGADLAGAQTMLTVWGPRVIVAIVVLVVAYIVGRAVKWALARLVDKLPGANQHNAGKEPKSTVGAKLGDVAYWLVLLFGIVAALNVLQLGEVVAPLNAMLANFLGYIPNVVGAGLLFFVGFIVATLARRVVTTALSAANLDRLLGRAGLSGVTSGGTLAGAVGTLVFVLIIIPVAIAALQTLQIDAISRPAIAMLSTILNAVPNVLAAAIVLAIGWFIGKWIAGVIERVLPATGFDRSVSALGGMSSYARPNGNGTPAGQAARAATDTTTAAPSTAEGFGAPTGVAVPPSGGVSPSKVVANLVLFGVVAFSAIEAARLIQFAAIAGIIEDILGLAGRIVVGGIIITAGVLIGDLLSNVIARSTAAADRFVAGLVRWATVALAAAMGLKFMGIADSIVTLAFGLILGAAAVATALAFGIGGRDAAGRLVSRWVDRAQQPRPAGAPAAREEGKGSEPRSYPGGSPERFQ